MQSRFHSTSRPKDNNVAIHTNRRYSRINCLLHVLFLGVICLVKDVARSYSNCYCKPATCYQSQLKNMYRVSVELHVQKHEWKFGRTRNAVGMRAAGECFHSFFEFSQTFTSVSITPQKQGVHVFYFFQKTPRREKGKLVNFDY